MAAMRLPMSYFAARPGQLGIANSAAPARIGSTAARPFYVDAESAVASDNADGEDPAAPLATIMAAHERAVSGRGDVIYVMPGTYEEDVVITKNYVSLVGALPGGYARPDLVGSVGVALTVHAQGFVATHLRLAAVAGQDGVRQQGNGFLYDGCVFDGDTANDFNLLPDLDDDSYTASEGQILGSLFRSGGKGLMFTNPGPGVEGGVGPSDVLVQGCRFYGHTTNDIDDTDTAGSDDTTFGNCAIISNYFMKVSAAYVYISLAAGGANSGLISGNYFADAALIAAQIAVPAGVLFIGNYDGTGIAAPA